jgi:hypothetical protein
MRRRPRRRVSPARPVRHGARSGLDPPASRGSGRASGPRPVTEHAMPCSSAHGWQRSLACPQRACMHGWRACMHGWRTGAPTSVASTGRAFGAWRSDFTVSGPIIPLAPYSTTRSPLDGIQAPGALSAGGRGTAGGSAGVGARPVSAPKWSMVKMRL